MADIEKEFYLLMDNKKSFKYDVFIRHSKKNKAVVRKLVKRLKADGLSVWFDEWIIKPGDKIDLKIEQGLEQSRTQILVMSEAAFASGGQKPFWKKVSGLPKTSIKASKRQFFRYQFIGALNGCTRRMLSGLPKTFVKPLRGTGNIRTPSRWRGDLYKKFLSNFFLFFTFF